MFAPKPISDRQKSVLEFIKDFIADKSCPPTVREIQKGFGISSTSVVDYNLHILQRRGFLRRHPDISRGIELLGKHGARLMNAVQIPVYGKIAAGQPLHMPSASSWEVDEFDVIDVPVAMLKGRGMLLHWKFRATQ